MSKIARFVFLGLGFAFLVQHALAAPPQTINYQGYLTNTAGAPSNATVSMTFSFYNAPGSNMPLYVESQPAVVVTNGNFNVVIGSVTPITLGFDEPYWLGVQINTDGEMSPRQPLAASPYSFRAASLDSAATVTGGQITGSLPGTIISGNLDGSKITGTVNFAFVDGGRLINTLNAAANIAMVSSTATVGNIMKGSSRFIHNFGVNNTFVGLNSGNFSLSGAFNTAIGTTALQALTTGGDNVALGSGALAANTSGAFNIAIGSGALPINTTGFNNTAIGTGALSANTAGGSQNTALGRNALSNNTTGTGNVAIGVGAGTGLTTGSNNIYLKANAAVDSEADTLRIGFTQTRAFMAGVQNATITGNPVFVNPGNGQLGISASSGRFKEEIADMGEASARLMQLRPVNFRYKAEYDVGENGVRQTQYGLIAEEVAPIYPDLISRDVDGRILTVRYHFLPPMLLNEVQKQQRTIAAQATELAQQRERMVTLESELRSIKALLGI
ncbi:MAG: tail fiber domain-containing protein [Usitatibacteraceae bacterium]